MKNVGIILGSGLDKFTEEISEPKIIFEDLNGIHQKKIITGKIGDKNVTIFSGRNHIYEMPPKDKLFFNINFAHNRKIDFLIITNAAGGLRKDFKISDLMLINSYINFQFKFQKGNISRFVEDKELFNRITSLALENHIPLKRGVYLAALGPQYESSAEISFLKKFNIDAVGMSTLPEIYMANRYNIRTIGISCITNLLSSENTEMVTHNEVLEAGKMAYKNFSELLKLIINL